MSTLATNKIGTLAGTADMSLPTTRPSQTLSAFLDSAGKLTFEETTTPVEFFVADGTTFVSSVLVDTAYLTSAGWPLDALTNNSGQIYGARVGMWNLSEAIKTNYLFQKNLRWFELNAWGVSTGSNDAARPWIQILNPTGGLMYTQNQTMGYKYCSLNSSSSSSQGGAATSLTWYAGTSGSRQDGAEVSDKQIGEGDTEPMPWSMKIRVSAKINYGFKIDAEGTISESSSYPPAWTYRVLRPRVDQTIDDTTLTRGGPWTDFGGFYFGTNQESSDKATTGQFASLILKAQIKPTAVVTT